MRKYIIGALTAILISANFNFAFAEAENRPLKTYRQIQETLRSGDCHRYVQRKLDIHSYNCFTKIEREYTIFKENQSEFKLMNMDRVAEALFTNGYSFVDIAEAYDSVIWPIAFGAPSVSIESSIVSLFDLTMIYAPLAKTLNK